MARRFNVHTISSVYFILMLLICFMQSHHSLTHSDALQQDDDLINELDRPSKFILIDYNFYFIEILS